MKFNYLLQELQFSVWRRLADKHFRWWWRLGMLLLLGSAVTVIVVTIQRFLSNPTYIIRDESFESTREFPSVIVCPEVVFLDGKVEAFSEKMIIPPSLNISYEFIKSTVNQVSAYFAPDMKYKTEDLQKLEELLEYNDMDLETAVQLLAITCDETLIRCRWNGMIVNCSDLFMMELTGDGYCCVFNGQSLKRLARNPDNANDPITKYAGFTSGLMLAVDQSQKPVNVDLSYKWLALQSSRHFVESSINGTPLNPGHEQWAAMHIQNFQIGEAARSLNEGLKICRMREDRLEYFPVYYKRYCLVECEMYRTLKRCNCVRHVHPRPKGVKLCLAENLLCATHAKVTYDSNECNCPSACDVATNYVTTISFKLIPGSHPLDLFYKDLNLEKVTIVRAFLQSRKEVISTRWSFFSKLDLFSQMGGVFNLFFGCSILTILELAFLGMHWLKRAPKNSIKTGHDKNTQEIKKKGERRLIRGRRI